MLRISQLKLPVTHTREQLEQKLLKMLRISRKDLGQYYIRKRSLDARKKPELYYVYSIDAEIKHEERVLKSMKGNVRKVSGRPYSVPEHGTERLSDRPVVIGSGPAGLFCAYLLASEGYHPLIIERGAPVRERKRDVEKFWDLVEDNLKKYSFMEHFVIISNVYLTMQTNTWRTEKLIL